MLLQYGAFTRVHVGTVYMSIQLGRCVDRCLGSMTKILTGNEHKGRTSELMLMLEKRRRNDDAFKPMLGTIMYLEQLTHTSRAS